MAPLLKRSLYMLFDLAVVASLVAAGFYLCGRSGAPSPAAPARPITVGDDTAAPLVAVELHDPPTEVDRARRAAVEAELVTRLQELDRLADPVLDAVDLLINRWDDAWMESQKATLVEGFIGRTLAPYDAFKAKMDEFDVLDERLAGMGGGLDTAHRSKMDKFHELAEVVDRWRDMDTFDRVMGRW